MSDDAARPPRRRRRAVGPAGGAEGAEPALDLEPDRADERDDAERLRRDVPPHHDRGV